MRMGRHPRGVMRTRGACDNGTCDAISRFEGTGAHPIMCASVRIRFLQRVGGGTYAGTCLACAERVANVSNGRERAVCFLVVKAVWTAVWSMGEEVRVS